MLEPISISRFAINRASKPSTAIQSHSNNEKDSINNSSQKIKEKEKKEKAIEELMQSSKDVVEHTVQAIKNYIESNKRSLDITVHQGTGDIIVKVISEKDGKIIREIPPEKFLDLASNMEELAGMLFNENA